MSDRPRDDLPLPPDLRELDERLHAVRFEPRASLGAEIAGRARRGERPVGAPPDRSHRRHAALAAAAVAALLLAWRAVPVADGDVTIDRCCFDLDGGVDADDGVVIVAGPDESVRRLLVYEDADGSGGFSDGDIVRFTRGADPTVLPAGDPELVAFQHCCLDYDGGGLADDGVLVVGRPPDQVVMAALFEVGRNGRVDGDPRRYRLR